MAVAQTRRVHFARNLVEQTELPMARIALAAGFHNVRRFNAAIRRSFDRTPSEIRRAADRPFVDRAVADLVADEPVEMVQFYIDDLKVK